MFKWLNLALAGVLLALIFVWRQWPDNNLHLIACDVGQGDGILLIYKDKQLLVDAGPNDSIVACLGRHMPFWDKTLEAVVITHPQTDHMTGLVAVLDSYRVKQLFMADLVNDIADFWALKQAVIDSKVPVSELLAGDRLSFAPVEMTVLWPRQKGGGQTVKDPNVFSNVMLGSFGQSRFLLTGDIDMAIEKQLLSEGLSAVEVLKVAHHGSKYSTSEDFLKAVRPKVALISAGAKNRFGHPTLEVLERLGAVGARVFRTDELGDVELISNGVSWWQN